MKKQLFLPLLILLFLILGTALVVAFARGYRFWIHNGKPEFAGTGLLVAKSIPDGASVYINDKLTTATDNTINLAPGQYTVKIQKDGYFVWQKIITVQKEVVSKAEALLFPTAPKLENITSTGVENPIIDPTLTRIAYTISSQSAQKNGIFVLDMSSKPILNLQISSTQIADDSILPFSASGLSWSADGGDIVATPATSLSTFLLKSNILNQSPLDVTTTMETLMNSWNDERNEKEKARLDGLKKQLKTFIVESFTIISWSPDESKILYVASQSAKLPIIIKPPLIGTNNTEEDRNLKENTLYVYDIAEDRNYLLNIGDQPLEWFPDSKHFIFVHDKRIDILEYDGKNQTTVYAGPFIDNYVFPWPNGSKIVILTNLNNPNIAPNLYTISLK